MNILRRFVSLVLFSLQPLCWSARNPLAAHCLCFSIRSILLALCVFPAVAPGITFADGGPDTCGEERHYSKAEIDWALHAQQVMQDAMPTPPPGWRVTEVTPIDSEFDELICSGAPEPFDLTLAVSYANDEKINDNAKEFESNNVGAQIEKLSAEIIAAASRGDQAKIAALQSQLQSLTTQTGNDMMARVEMRANFGSVVEGKENFRSYQIPGIVQGYIQENFNDTKIVLYLGRWEKVSGDEILQHFDLSGSNAAVHFMEIVITGAIADTLAHSIDIAALKSLLQ